jgi:hypothetical protein
MEGKKGLSFCLLIPEYFKPVSLKLLKLLKFKKCRLFINLSLYLEKE